VRRSTSTEVDCYVCGCVGPGIAIAAESPGGPPGLLELCLGCLDEMFDVARLLEMRLANERPQARNPNYGPDWTQTRDAILERDGRTCQDEGHQRVGGVELRESLVVHHIRPLRQFNGDYIAANQPENLITLCTICHGRWHAELNRQAKQQ
jgi:predicted HNH restriction endonuclease